MLVWSWPVGAGMPVRARRRRTGSGCPGDPRRPRPGSRGRRAWRPARGDGRGRPGRHGRVVLGPPGGRPRPSSWWPPLGVGQLVGQERPALGGGHGDGRHPLDVGQVGPRRRHQVEVDVQHDLPLDAQVEVEDQAVDDVPDGALDGVLQRDEAEVEPSRPGPQSRTSMNDGSGAMLGRASPASLRSASSVKVPSGPRKPIRRVGPSTASEDAPVAYPGRIVNVMDEPALQRLLDECGPGPCSPTRWCAGCAGCPSPTWGSPRSTTTARSGRACPRRSTVRERRAEQCSAIVGELLAGADGGSESSGDPRRMPPGGAVGRRAPPAGRRTVTGPATAGGPGPGRPRPRWCGGRRRPGRPETVVVTAGTADLPVAGSARPPCRPSVSRPTLVADCGVAGRAPAAGLGRRAGRRRRGRGGGRHGGGSGQPGRRPHPGAGRGRARPAPDTGPPWRG